MKKMFKKAVVAALTTAMALGSVIAQPMQAKADTGEYEMFLAYGGGSGWEYQYYGEGATDNSGDVVGTTAKATDGSTVTVGVTLPAAADQSWFWAPVLVVDDGAANIAVDYTIDKVTINGEDVTSQVDLSVSTNGTNWAEGTGNYTETQAVRLCGGYNEWADKFIPTAPADITEIMYTITINSVTMNAASDDGSDDGSSDSTGFDPSGKYNAYMGIQTPSWSFRNAWDDKDYGIESDVFNQITGWDADNNAVAREGVITDVEIAGNGTYTVGVSGIGSWVGGELESSEGIFNLLFVSTNIPLSDDLKITDVKLIVDGTVKHTDSEAYLDPDATDYAKILVQNIWNENKAEISYYPVPTDSVEIQFTVSGFDYDNEASAADDKADDANKDSANKDSANKETDTTKADSDDKEESGSNITVIIVVVVVIAVVAVVAVMMSKKKK